MEAKIQLLDVLTALELWAEVEHRCHSHAYFCLAVWITNHEFTPVLVSPIPSQPASTTGFALPPHTGNSFDTHYPLYGVFLPLVSQCPTWVTTLLPHHVPASSSGSEPPSKLPQCPLLHADPDCSDPLGVFGLTVEDQNTHDTLSQV